MCHKQDVMQMLLMQRAQGGKLVVGVHVLKLQNHKLVVFDREQSHASVSIH